MGGSVASVLADTAVNDSVIVWILVVLFLIAGIIFFLHRS